MKSRGCCTFNVNWPVTLLLCLRPVAVVEQPGHPSVPGTKPMMVPGGYTTAGEPRCWEHLFADPATVVTP